jgi:tetratricopeptide (TPR) repeat protein
MRLPQHCRVFLAAHLLILASAQACLWDTDTIATEKARFPEVADLIGGSFPRHSKEFYQWRKARCEAALAKEGQAPGVYDDLAVAQHKLGDHLAAIATMQAKEKVHSHLYETCSNLGTFYIYTNDLDQAEVWIQRALDINKDAHFGREQYQLWLVQWLKAGKPELGKRRLGEGVRDFRGFAAFIVEKSGFRGLPQEWKEGRAAALRGISGMMRFADHDNPLLLEALGDVLTAGIDTENATLLAAQSYLLASRKSKSSAEKQRLWGLMASAGGSVDDYKPRDTMRTLDAATAEGARFAAKIRQDELAWIKAGKDVAAEFAAKYLKTSE